MQQLGLPLHQVEGCSDQQRRIVVERCGAAARAAPTKDGSARDNVQVAI